MNRDGMVIRDIAAKELREVLASTEAQMIQGQVIFINGGQYIV